MIWSSVKKHLFDLSLRRQIAIFEVMDALEISVFSKTVEVKAGSVLLANKIRLQNYDKPVLEDERYHFWIGFA